MHILADTVKAVPRIKEALDWIAVDVTRPENDATWVRLQEIEPARSRHRVGDGGTDVAALGDVAGLAEAS